MAPKRILVVEDNPRNLKLVRVLLEGEGYEVLETGHGERVVHLARSWRPDLILMDIQLPGMDGLAATRELKADPATRDIPIIAMTALAMKGDRERALEAGCDAYIRKPMRTVEFLRAVSELLGGGSER
jgi:two-component system cell cycle response regulator DivK